MKKLFFKKQTLIFLSLVLVLSFSLAFVTNELQKAAAQTTDASITNIFSRQLSLGMSGEDVRTLQKILNYSSDTQVASSGTGSPGLESTYFGVLTKAAVTRFQQKYAVDTLSATNGLSVGTGVASIATELKLSSLYSNKPSVSTSANNTVATAPLTLLPYKTYGTPQLVSISPSLVHDGDVIIIKGNNFSALNTVNTTFDSYSNATSTDSHTIQVVIHSQLQQMFDAEINKISDKDDRKKARSKALSYMDKNFAASSTPGIPFTITVENQSGTSEPITIYFKMK